MHEPTTAGERGASQAPVAGEAPAYLKPYADAVGRAGPRFESLLWKDRSTQSARFRAACELLDPTGLVVADLGCGLADYAAFMHTSGIEYGRYIGVEGVPALLEAAAARVLRERVPECVLLPGDFVADTGLFERLMTERRVDVLNFGGSLNTLSHDAALKVLERAWAAVAATGGGSAPGKHRDAALVFNFLSDRHGGDMGPTAPAQRFRTLELLDWAMTRTRRVQFRQDYLNGHDALIVMQP